MTKSIGRYDPDVLAALRQILAAESHDEERTVRTNELVDGMILAQDIRFLDGRMFVARGYEVNRTLRERIKNFSQKPGIREPVRVTVPAKLILEGRMRQNDHDSHRSAG